MPSDTPRRGRKPTPRGVLPGEPNPNAPKPKSPRDRGGDGRPMPTEPNPAARYKAMKKAFQTPGIQPGENDWIKAIAKHRGVSRAEARAIGKKRTARGYNTAGINGPKGLAVKEPMRKPVADPSPIKQVPTKSAPESTPMPKIPNPGTPVGSSSMPKPKRPRGSGASGGSGAGKGRRLPVKGGK